MKDFFSPSKRKDLQLLVEKDVILEELLNLESLK